MKKIFLLSILFVTSSCAFMGLNGREEQKRSAEVRKEINAFETPTIENSLYETALKALENGEYAKAEQYLVQLHEGNPENPDYAQKYADLGRKMGRCKDSLRIYDQLIAADAGSLEYREGKALCQLSMGEYDEAGRAFTDIMQKDSTRWRSINGAGLIFVSRNKLAEANQYFTLAADVSGQDASVLNNQGLTKALVGNYTDAIDVLKLASRNAAGTPEQKRRVDLNLALVYGISGDIDAAKRAAAPHLTEPQLYNNLGIYSELGSQPELAKTYLNKALAVTTVYYDRAWENLERIEGR